MNRRVTVAALVMGALGLSLLAAPGSAADPFEIHAIISVTGQGAFLGKTETDTLTVLTDRINRAGGVRGRPVKFVVHDDQSSPQVGVQIANQLIAQKVTAFLGPGLTSVCNAVAPLLAAGPVSYCFSPGIRPADGDYMFAGNIATVDSLTAMAAFMRDRGWQRVASITTTDSTGQDANRSIHDVLTKAPGEEIVADEHFGPTDLSVDAQMARIKTSNAQVLIAWGVGAPIATVLRAIQETGFDKPIFLGGGNVTYAQMKAYAAFLPKELYFPSTPNVAPEQLPNGPVKRSVLQFVDAFKTIGVRPDIGQASPWDDTLLIVGAYQKLGLDATAAQIRNYLATLRDWSGVEGTFDFVGLPQRGLNYKDAVIVRWDAAHNAFVGASRFGGAAL